MANNLRSFLAFGIGFLLTAPVFARGAFTPINASLRVPRFGLHASLPKSNITAFSRIPGLSGASSLSFTQTKLITGAGINLGVAKSVQNAFANGIASGQLQGTLYESTDGANPYTVFTGYTLGFGNNPLNGMGQFPTMDAPPNVTNSIMFNGVGGHVPGSAHGLGSTRFQLTGSAGRAQNQLHSLALNSVGLGQKYGTSLLTSPIVGGNLFGTAYCQCVPGGPPFMYMKDGTFDYSFGNNPLNIAVNPGIADLNTGSLQNYIQLANGMRINFGSGLMAASGYFSTGSFDNNWIFASGSHPLNFFHNFGAAPSDISFNAFPKTSFAVSSFFFPKHAH
jgi:hypothetical protein